MDFDELIDNFLRKKTLDSDRARVYRLIKSYFLYLLFYLHSSIGKNVKKLEKEVVVFFLSASMSYFVAPLLLVLYTSCYHITNAINFVFINICVIRL